MKKLNFYVAFLFLLLISGCAKDELIDIEQQQIEAETDNLSANKEAPISEPAPIPGDEDDPADSGLGSIDNPIQLEAVEVVHTMTTYILISFSTERSMNIRDLAFTESDLPGIDFGQFSGGGISPLVEALLEEAAENALQDLEEWEEQIDDANLKQCLKDILNKMTSLQTGVGFILRNFAGNTPGFNWKVKDGPLPQDNQSGNTSPASYDPATGNITTTFNIEEFPEGSDLHWARVILHEAVHAYLYQYFRINNHNFTVSYPNMVEDYGRFSNWNNVHHEEIAISLVTSIGLSLEEYGKSQGYNLSSQFYKDLAWGGLQGTSTFRDLSSTEKNRILNVIQVEATSKNTEGYNVNPKGKNSGC